MAAPDNSLITAREIASRTSDRPQDCNRLWWERLPMTYVDWNAPDRKPHDNISFQRLFDYVLTNSPFLSAWFSGRTFKGQRVLDLGCGTGVFAALLARLGGVVSAIDLTEYGVKTAVETAARQGVQVSVARMDAENLAFKDAAFDFIYSWGVLHHTANMESAISEVYRILKPGGQGMMMVYHRRSIVYYGLGLFWLLVKGKIFSGHSLASATNFYTDGYFHRYMTRAELSAMLARHGLMVARMHVTQYRKPILPLMPSLIDRWLKSRFGMCLVAEFSKSSC
jgi:2-polyprenyl-3-methyl-5-hydroxy-6-metoxy-1,4-benzoquinol methylase